MTLNVGGLPELRADGSASRLTSHNRRQPNPRQTRPPVMATERPRPWVGEERPTRKRSPTFALTFPRLPDQSLVDPRHHRAGVDELVNRSRSFERRVRGVAEFARLDASRGYLAGEPAARHGTTGGSGEDDETTEPRA